MNLTDSKTCEAFAALLQDPDNAMALFALEDPADAQKYLADHGVAMTVDEVTALGKAAMAGRNGELSEDDLAAVAGGHLGDWCLSVLMGTLNVLSFIGSFRW